MLRFGCTSFQPSNRPPLYNFFFCITFKNSDVSGVIGQIAITYDGTKAWNRYYNSGWSAWTELWNN